MEFGLTGGHTAETVLDPCVRRRDGSGHVRRSETASRGVLWLAVHTRFLRALTCPHPPRGRGGVRLLRVEPGRLTARESPKEPCLYCDSPAPSGADGDAAPERPHGRAVGPDTVAL